MTVAMNDFARRHKAVSAFSHYIGSESELCELVERNLDKATKLSPGVFSVPVPPKDFFTSQVLLTPEVEVSTTFAPRREGEGAFLAHRAKGGKKVRAASVDIICYTHENLGDEAGTNADLEIVSINAKAFIGAEPCDPVTMARNYLELPGGTKCDYTARQFAEAIVHHFGGDPEKPVYIKLEG